MKRCSFEVAAAPDRPYWRQDYGLASWRGPCRLQQQCVSDLGARYGDRLQVAVGPSKNTHADHLQDLQAE